MAKKINISPATFDGWRLELFNSNGVRILRAYSRTYYPLRVFSDNFLDSFLYCVHIRPCVLPPQLRLVQASSVAWGWGGAFDDGKYIVA